MASGFVPYTQRVGYLLNGLPGPHQRRLHKQAVKQNTSVANLIGETLASRYSLPYERSSRPLINHNAAAVGDRVSLRLPQEVLHHVRAEAEARNVTMRSVILDALSEALKLKAPAATSVGPGKRPGRPRKP